MLNIKKNLQKKLSAASCKLSAFRKLTANSYKLKANLGFTLIELLVVIAIIGILSSVVLASLNSARNKGADAAVKSNMQSIRAQAEIWYEDNSSRYSSAATLTCTAAGSFFTGSPVVVNALAQITANNNGVNILCFTDSTGQLWAMSTTLRGAGVAYCVDNSGASKKNSSAQSTGTCS